MELPELIATFRNKFSVRNSFRQRTPDVRINSSQLVSGFPKLLASDPGTYSHSSSSRPTALGNRDILIRSWPPDTEELNAYFMVRVSVHDGGRSTDPSSASSGQIDGDGEPTVVAIGGYLRAQWVIAPTCRSASSPC